MPNFTDSLIASAKLGLCNYLGDAGKADRWLSSKVGFQTGIPARAVRLLACDNPDEPPPEPPPFTGGQCPTVYTVFTTETNSQGNSFPDSYSNVLGPIEGIIRQEVPRPPPSTGCDYNIFIRSAGGDIPTSVSGSGPCGQPRNTVITSVVRADGQPDDCGDPTPEQQPFPQEGDTYDISVTYEDNTQNIRNINGSIRLFAPIFAPVFAPITTVIAPVRFEAPDLNLNGYVTLSPDFNFTFRPGGWDESPGSPGGPDGPFPPLDSPDTPDDDKSARLVGVFVRSQIEDANAVKATALFKGDEPTLYVPRLASVFFRVRMGGRLGWTGPVDVKTVDAYVPVPPDTFAIAFRITPEPGFSAFGTSVFGYGPSVPGS